jgi:hypothetical protein
MSDLAEPAPSPSGDGEIGFSDTASSAGRITPKTATHLAPTAPSDEDGLVFTDEIGGKPGVPVAPAPAPPAAAAAAAPAKPPPGPRNPGARVSSDRLKAIAPAAPPAKSKPAESGLDLAIGRRSRTSSERQLAIDGKGDPLAGSGGFRQRVKKEDPAFEPIAPGITLGEWKVVAASGQEEGVRTFKVEKNGREATLREHVLLPAAASDLAARVERLNAINHDELEKVQASGRSRAGAWYVVDTRTSLARSVAEGGPLTEREALAAIRSAARALSALHARGLSHGNPAPRHLLLDAAAGAVKLGTPVRVRTYAQLLQGGPIPGDPRFAAPEVLDGEMPTAASDVFTLGLAYLALVSGKDPVTVAAVPGSPGTIDPLAALAARSGRMVPDLKTFVRDASPGALALYALMTDRDPSRRPQPTELSQLVDAYLEQGRVPDPLPVKAPAKLPRPILSKQVALALAIVALIAATIAGLAAARITIEDPTQSFGFRVPTDGR